MAYNDPDFSLKWFSYEQRCAIAKRVLAQEDIDTISFDTGVPLQVLFAWGGQFANRPDKAFPTALSEEEALAEFGPQDARGLRSIGPSTSHEVPSFPEVPTDPPQPPRSKAAKVQEPAVFDVDEDLTLAEEPEYNAVKELGESKDLEPMSSFLPPNEPLMYTTVGWVAWVLKVINVYGWISQESALDQKVKPTTEIALRLLCLSWRPRDAQEEALSERIVPPTEQDLKGAQYIVSWGRGLRKPHEKPLLNEVRRACTSKKIDLTDNFFTKMTAAAISTFAQKTKNGRAALKAKCLVISGPREIALPEVEAREPLAVLETPKVLKPAEVLTPRFEVKKRCELQVEFTAKEIVRGVRGDARCLRYILLANTGETLAWETTTVLRTCGAIGGESGTGYAVVGQTLRVKATVKSIGDVVEIQNVKVLEVI